MAKKRDRREYNKKRYEENRVIYRKQQKEYYANMKDEYRNYRYQHTYGITLEDDNKMFNEQNGCCAICGRHQSEFKITFAVDHNHETGKIRSLLCIFCNHLLGNAYDDVEILQNAIEYLRRYNEQDEFTKN